MVISVLASGFLFTDHYQLTMAQLYHRFGLHDRLAQFDYSYRSNPDYGTHQAGYAVTAGLGPLLDWMDRTRVEPADTAALGALQSAAGTPMFSRDFLEWMSSAAYSAVSMWAVPEGRIVHPNTPLAVVEAPLAIAQMLETPLLNHLNYASLIATKASRVVEAAHEGPVFEFGMRRAPGWGANDATRAALIGGATASSNLGMSLELGLASQGTHGHSMVQVFMSIAGGELEAFRAYADVYPDNCLLLVDTIDTLGSGVPNAVRVFEELRSAGHEPRGIRLDSGDLAHLAVRSARMLNEAGFPDVRIVLSSQLDELTIWQIRNQIIDEAPRYEVEAASVLARLVYGVGSRMVTSHGDSSFDGVYKVVAVQNASREWRPAIKISDSPAKLAYPGRKGLWRVYDQRGIATADLVTLAEETPDGRPLHLIHPVQAGVGRVLGDEEISDTEPLLIPICAKGRRVVDLGGVAEARSRRVADLGRLDPGVRRLVNPHTYHVSLSPRLVDLKQTMMDALVEIPG
ncbi:MAG: nicotinate phosphoribosyltransferase [Acidimicrobiia bacterium]|nr:nicotinate phosphoribosyltransferase [Acidimicrobiia bacterium]